MNMRFIRKQSTVQKWISIGLLAICVSFSAGCSKDEAGKSAPEPAETSQAPDSATKKPTIEGNPYEVSGVTDIDAFLEVFNETKEAIPLQPTTKKRQQVLSSIHSLSMEQIR